MALFERGFLGFLWHRFLIRSQIFKVQLYGFGGLIALCAQSPRLIPCVGVTPFIALFKGGFVGFLWHHFLICPQLVEVQLDEFVGLLALCAGSPRHSSCVSATPLMTLFKGGFVGFLWHRCIIHSQLFEAELDGVGGLITFCA